MSRQRDCVRCGSADLLPEDTLPTNAGAICRACGIADATLFMAALGVRNGFPWDSSGVTVGWDEMRTFLAGFKDDCHDMRTKHRVVHYTALDVYRAERWAASENDGQLAVRDHQGAGT